MPEAKDIEGVVFERSSAVLLARVGYADGGRVTPAQINAVSYTIEQTGDCRTAASGVSGHESVSLTPSAVLFATLQQSDEWTVDTTGYNFRHELDVGQNDAFPTAGRSYTVRYELTPTAGQPVVLRFLMRAI